MRKLSRIHCAYYARLIALAAVFIGVSLLAGVCGYHYLESLPWIDALLEASMILGGMGPVAPLHTDAGKLFASFYALYSCFVVLGMAGILLMPILHSVLHRFHADRDH